MIGSILTADLLKLRTSFQKRGFDIRLVGGCVRDLLQGNPHKDIDFATDAYPAEQRQIYIEDGIEHIPTGIQHGTYTVVLNHIAYEITSLRTESNHDGRYATMAWTRDWIEDLSRRDLTINAMSLTFDGQLIDPFSGKSDLETGTLRFVGDPEKRMREDYLRILRFFRFFAKTPNAIISGDTWRAIYDCKNGLENISRERVWSEISRTLPAKHGAIAFNTIINMGVWRHIDLPEPLPYPRGRIEQVCSKNPVTIIAAYLETEDRALQLAIDWKWSVAERKLVLYLVRNPLCDVEIAKRRIAVENHPKDWVIEHFKMHGQIPSEIVQWDVPKFPVGGDDLLALGLKGVELGNALTKLRDIWGDSDYMMDKAALLRML